MNACGGEILHIVQKDTQLTWLTQSDRSYGRKLMAMFSSRSVANCVMLYVRLIPRLCRRLLWSVN